eukprot:gene24618-10239_t
MSTAGRNWGHLAIEGGSLMFLVDGKVAFEAPLRDVTGCPLALLDFQSACVLVVGGGSLMFLVDDKVAFEAPLRDAQQQKDDVVIEFAADDTVGDDKEDLLMEIGFHVPPANEEWAPESETTGNAAKSLCDSVLQHTEGGGGSLDDSVCVFGEVGVIAPRGRFEVEMHMSYVALVGQTQDFKIRYTSIQRIFILPKQNTPHTLVVVSLDPPIRKGQTYYTHVLCQFPSDIDETMELDITPEQIAQKNEKHPNAKLEPSYSGPIYEVFAKSLRGLSGSKIVKPGHFRSADGEVLLLGPEASYSGEWESRVTASTVPPGEVLLLGPEASYAGEWESRVTASTVPPGEVLLLDPEASYAGEWESRVTASTVPPGEVLLLGPEASYAGPEASYAGEWESRVTASTVPPGEVLLLGPEASYAGEWESRVTASTVPPGEVLLLGPEASYAGEWESRVTASTVPPGEVLLLGPEASYAGEWESRVTASTVPPVEVLLLGPEASYAGEWESRVTASTVPPGEVLLRPEASYAGEWESRVTASTVPPGEVLLLPEASYAGEWESRVTASTVPPGEVLLLPEASYAGASAVPNGRTCFSSSQPRRSEGISRAEWQNLFEFITAKKIRVENLASAQEGPGGPARVLPEMEGLGFDDDDDSDEDEDFDAGGGSGGGSGDDDEESDTDEESGDAEMVAEEGSGSGSCGDDEESDTDEESGDAEMVAEEAKKGKKRSAEDGGDDDIIIDDLKEEKKAAKKAKVAAAKEEKKEKGEGKEKKSRKKKDPNAPKKALSAFMYFSSENRERVKKENPEATFGDMGKLLGTEWKAMEGTDGKAKYEEMAAADKGRYAAAMAAYKGSGDGVKAEEEEEVEEDDE